MSLVRELTGNLWHYHETGDWIAIATNGIVKANGQAVMGAGQAKDAASRFPTLPKRLGTRLRVFGNVPHDFSDVRLITWPTKDHFAAEAHLSLILNGVAHIRRLLDLHQISQLYCPRPGCGLGKLRWEDVRTALSDVVDDRFIFMSFERGSH